MTTVFRDEDLVAAFKQKRRLFWIYMAATAAFAALLIGCIVWYVSMPSQDSLMYLPQLILCVAACIYIIFSFIFLGIKFQRVRKYYKMIASLSVGMKHVNSSYFLRYATPELNDSVDYYVLTMCEWSKKKSEYLDRKIYCDKEKPCPEFAAGDKVSYLTHGNTMIGYEIVGHSDRFVTERTAEESGQQPEKHQEEE